MADLSFEAAVIERHGTTAIAGLDEAGRGALAGPVVAAAAILPLTASAQMSSLSAVNDSKQLSARIRDELYTAIVENALSYGVGVRSAAFVDAHGIIAATKQAMADALGQLNPHAEYLLIDGRIRLLKNPLPQQSIVRGDSKSLSIAAASIIAKVTRDRIMIALDQDYPKYDFAQHKGYGTRKHIAILDRLGPTLEHRRTFSPLRATLL